MQRAAVLQFLEFSCSIEPRFTLLRIYLVIGWKAENGKRKTENGERKIENEIRNIIRNMDYRERDTENGKRNHKIRKMRSTVKKNKK